MSTRVIKPKRRETSGIAERALTRHGVRHLGDALKQVDAKSFHSAFSSYKNSSANSKKWMVDEHSVKQLSKMKCYMNSDGSAGYAIEKGGNVVGVFSTRGGRSAMEKIITSAVSNGGKKLDCYAGNLQNLYARLGAKAISKTKWNDEFAPDGWDGESRPDLVAMALPRSVQEVARNYDKTAAVDMSKVKEYSDYDGMIKARDNYVAEREAAARANSKSRYVNVRG